MAKLYLKNKDYKMAEKSFNEYLSMNPEDVAALKLLAQVHEHNKHFDKAFEMYERCYLAEPDRTGVLLDICRILLMNEVWLDHVDYRKWLNLAIKAFPNNPIVVNFKSFLSTLPPEEANSPPREVKAKVSSRGQLEDPLAKILEKLSLMETRLEKIETKISNLTTHNSATPQQPQLVIPPPATLQTTPVLPAPMPVVASLPEPIPQKENSPKPSPPKSSPPKATIAPVNNQATPNMFSFSTNLFSESTKNITFPSQFQFGQAASFSSPNNASISSTFSQGNLFANSMKKLNIPTEGTWEIKPFGTNFSFSQTKPQDNENEDTENDADNGVVPNEELAIENTCDMTPIEIKTGEEDEDNLFEHRCKLFRLRDKEYKERGLGSIKVLIHKTTGKGRLIMRREAVGLVCLNCWDCRSIERVKDTQVRWMGLDASDGDPELSIFLVRFKTQELTDTFMSHLTRLFSDAQGNSSVSSPQAKSSESKNKTLGASSDKPEIELVDPTLDPQLVDKARKFQLPDLFYHKLKNQDPCAGCQGCENDD